MCQKRERDSNNVENLCVSVDLIPINERDGTKAYIIFLIVFSSECIIYLIKLLYIVAIDSNNRIYEDAPDPRDGSVPGCSKDIRESITVTQCSQSNHMSTIEIDNSSTDSSSNKTHVKR